MPQEGFGVFQVSNDVCESVVLEAIETGYRLIDTASSYNNETAVGGAIRKSGLPREDFLVHPTFRVIRQSCRAYNLSLK